MMRTLAERYGGSLTGVEVGSYAGESALIAAETGFVSRLFCVDPWKSGWDPRDAASVTDMDEAEWEFDQRMAMYPTVIRKFKGTLLDFFVKYPDLKPDYVYIDAEHTYEAVRRDIGTALGFGPKAVCGHDYCEGWSGVMKAVNERFGAPDMVFEDDSWLVFLENRDVNR